MLNDIGTFSVLHIELYICAELCFLNHNHSLILEIKIITYIFFNVVLQSQKSAIFE